MSTRKETRIAYLKRLDGVVSKSFHDKTILVVGLGAGSFAAEKLARMLPRGVKLCDFDHVEHENLSRTAYTFEDAELGRPKSEALAQRIRAINPFVEVTPCLASFTDMLQGERLELLKGVDLIVAGTDYFPAQALVNALAVEHGIPAVFVGIHDNAEGGVIIWTVPGHTPCYRCLAGKRYETAEQGRLDDLNLRGALGSIWDCQFIDTIAHKVAVAILERGQDSQMGRFYESMVGRNEIVVRTDPHYEWGGLLWDAVLGDLPRDPKDYAKELKDEVLFCMDTIWLKGMKNPDCPVCGRISNQASN